MSDEMKTGPMPSVSSDLNVGGERKKVLHVDACEVMTQSSSRSRGGRMDLDPGTVNPIGAEDPSGNKDY